MPDQFSVSGVWIPCPNCGVAQRRQPYLPTEDIETLRGLSDDWEEGARLSEKHGQMFHTTPGAMMGRVAKLRAIIEKLEAK